MVQIIIRDLKKSFGAFTAVESSTFTIEDGEFFMLLGPSGCGKTTTLRMIAGLELPTSGEIFIGGEEVGMRPASQRDIAFVFQMFALYPHMTVRGNIIYPLISQGMKRKEANRKVDEVGRILEIEHMLDNPVGGLSGGDRQRVALGRAIVRDPKCFLMDEPLGALDAEFREHMSEELLALHKRMQATTVYVTHDQLEAMQMGDKIVVMNHGVIEQLGVPQDIYDWPATLFVANFIGSPPMNALSFSASVNPGATQVELGGEPFEVPPQTEGASGDLVFGVRPENVKISTDARYRGRVLSTEYLGTTQIITVDTPNGTLKARAPSSSSVVAGELIGLEFDTRTISLFDKASGRALLSQSNQEVLRHG